MDKTTTDGDVILHILNEKGKDGSLTIGDIISFYKDDSRVLKSRTIAEEMRDLEKQGFIEKNSRQVMWSITQKGLMKISDIPELSSSEAPTS